MDEDDEPGDEPVEMPIEDELDLHTFAPGDVRELVADYLELAAGKGFREVRIIHGKGKGTLRRTVQAVLDRHPRVVSYRLGRPKASHEFKLDVQNVLNADTTVLRYYDRRTETIQDVPQLAILPVVQYTLRF